MHSQAALQLEAFTTLLPTAAPIVSYRKLTGDFACASALATALAVSLFAAGTIPGALTGGSDRALTDRRNKILVLGLGQYITAIELYRP
jgi:3-oxoacyl-[acyl-carrier-protein] synthase-1/3-oxoacyl-[acyl-carrier-protein] synthase II